MADGSLIFDTKLDDKNMAGDVNSLKATMTGAFKKIGAAVATYLAVDKIVAFGKAAVKSAAEVSAEVSAFEQIMGDYAGAAGEKMKAVADATGVLDTRLTSYMTSMTAKFKGLGFDIADATDKAADGLMLASDAAAFWDKSLDDAMGALNSFINGSYQGGEAIGLFANETQMAQYAIQQGIVKNTAAWSALDEATKQATRLEYAQAMYDLSGATGQAAKEADQYLNVTGNLKEAWRQFTAIIGQPILEALTPVIKDITSALNDMRGEAGSVAGEIGKVAKKAADFAIGMVNNRDKIVGAIKAIVAAFVFAKSIASIVALEKAWRKATLAVQAHAAANHIMMIATAKSAAGLTAKQIAVGTLTGKITLAAAAQAAWGAAMAAMPLLPFLAIVGALGGAIAICAASTRDETEAIKEMKEAADEATRTLEAENAIRDQINENRQASIDAGLGEIAHYQNLKAELDTLVDSNGRVKEGYEARVSYILGELSAATGVEMSLQDGVVKGYADMGAAIDDYIAKMRAQIVMEANKEALTESIKNRRQWIADYQAANAEFEAYQAQYNAKLAEMQNSANGKERIALQQQLQAMEEHLAELGAARDGHLKNLDGSYNLEKQVMDEALAYQEGNYAAIMANNGELIQDFSSMTDANVATLQKGLDDLIEAKDTELAIYEQSGNDIVKQNADNYSKRIGDLEAHLASMGMTIDKNGKIVPQKTGEMMEGARKTADVIADQFDPIGKKAADDTASGVRSGAPGVGTAATSAMTNAKTAAGGVNWSSVGSDLIRGIINGIGMGLPTLIYAAANAAKAAFNAAKRALGISSPSRLARFGLGVPFSQGIALGITDSTSEVIASARQSATNAMAAFRTAINAEQTRTSMALAPITVVSGTPPAQSGGIAALTQNFYSPKALSESEISLATQNTVRRSKWEIK